MFLLHNRFHKQVTNPSTSYYMYLASIFSITTTTQCKHFSFFLYRFLASVGIARGQQITVYHLRHQTGLSSFYFKSYTTGLPHTLANKIPGFCQTFSRVKTNFSRLTCFCMERLNNRFSCYASSIETGKHKNILKETHILFLFKWDQFLCQPVFNYFADRESSKKNCRILNFS